MVDDFVLVKLKGSNISKTQHYLGVSGDVNETDFENIFMKKKLQKYTAYLPTIERD